MLLVFCTCQYPTEKSRVRKKAWILKKNKVSKCLVAIEVFLLRDFMQEGRWFSNCVTDSTGNHRLSGGTRKWCSVCLCLKHNNTRPASPSNMSLLMTLSLWMLTATSTDHMRSVNLMKLTPTRLAILSGQQRETICYKLGVYKITPSVLSIIQATINETFLLTMIMMLWNCRFNSFLCLIHFNICTIGGPCHIQIVTKLFPSTYVLASILGVN